jgi:hypothetical protein
MDLSIWRFPFVVVMYDHHYRRNAMDPRWIAIAPLPAIELARSGLPDAPVVRDRGRRQRREPRGFRARVMALLAGTRLEKEQPCGI